ncbi:restriction endonuclease subunit S [Pseudomonas viridiflava]|uniref:restriction endonuclease subunit S n=1 Tax=Pseudomonas viridiflava TaxID=33069 RepID=UPI000F04CC0B|nr:restriction endonuclease subunit S [Pseudomonas viridiflava]
MSKQEEKGLVPERRFPEFRNAGEWAVKQLGEFISTVKPPKKLLTTDYLADGRFPIIDQSQSYICGWTNDEDAIIDDHFPLIIFGDHTCVLKLVNQPFAQGADGIKIIKPNNSVKTNFLYQSLQFKPLVMEQYKRHFSILRERKVAYPDRKTGEQQKIAECLTSVDELITAQSQKIDALKTHKKGLMQQLFPAAGESVPKRRFPDFRNKGEWTVKKLSSMAQLISGLHLSPDQYASEGTTPYFTGPSDFTDNIQKISKWTDEPTGIGKENDTLITVKGSGVGELWYLRLPRISMGRQLMAIRSENNSSRFIYQFLLTKRTRFEDLASGNLIPGLSRGDILDLEARFPSLPEQHKIADCLTSVDELIAAKMLELNALKTHKKGLMQQIFPTINEMSA